MERVRHDERRNVILFRYAHVYESISQHLQISEKMFCDEIVFSSSVIRLPQTRKVLFCEKKVIKSTTSIVMEFPDEIWRLILNNLDTESLKKCLLLSEEFRELIIKTPQLMERLPVILFSDTWREKIPFLELYGHHIRSVQFVDCKISSFRVIKRILKLTPNLVELNIRNVIEENERLEDVLEDNLSDCFELLFNDVPDTDEASEESQTEPEEIRLEKLSQLRITDMCSSLSKELIESIRNCKGIKIFVMDFLASEPEKFIGDFISRQSNLEKLEINTYTETWFDSLLTEEFEKNANFKLKTLITNAALYFNQKFYNFLAQTSKQFDRTASEQHGELPLLPAGVKKFPQLEKAELSFPFYFK